MYKGKAVITGPCYYRSNGIDITIKEIISSPTVRFYDIDSKYNRILTEFGWCSFNFINDDASWMKKFYNRKITS